VPSDYRPLLTQEVCVRSKVSVIKTLKQNKNTE